MDEKQSGRNQSGYDRNTFGQVGRDPYRRDTFGQSNAQFQQTPPDGGAFYHSGEPPRGMGFGIASMVLGIVSIVLFCTCINIPFAIVAIIFGIVHICRRTGNNGFAIAGIVTSIVSVILTVILTIVLYTMGINSASSWIYNEYLPFYDEFYNDYDSYDYEDDYDGYFDGDDYDGVDF